MDDITLNQEINELLQDLEQISKYRELSTLESRSLRILKEIKKNGK